MSRMAPYGNYNSLWAIDLVSPFQECRPEKTIYMEIPPGCLEKDRQGKRKYDCSMSKEIPLRHLGFEKVQNEEVRFLSDSTFPLMENKK